MYHLYADDTQLYVSIDSSNPISINHTRERLVKCIAEIKLWMTENKLKFNADKTEVMVISSGFNKRQLSVLDLTVGDDVVGVSSSVRNLGVVFDKHMTMLNQISRVCSTCYYHLRNISRIRNALSIDAVKAITHAFVTSRVDYVILCSQVCP
jgi:hypothetical protein